MSNTISVFVDDACSMADLVSLAAEFIGHPLAADKDQAGLCTTWTCGLHVAAFEHDCENDAGINFEDYKYTVDFTRYAGVDDPTIAIDLCQSMALMMAHRIWVTKRAKCLVVRDLQSVITKFG
jgi:hypothetical protein